MNVLERRKTTTRRRLNIVLEEHVRNPLLYVHSSQDPHLKMFNLCSFFYLDVYNYFFVLFYSHDLRGHVKATNYSLQRVNHRFS